MSQTLSLSLARCYGMARVTRMWKVSRASVYRSLKETGPQARLYRACHQPYSATEVDGWQHKLSRVSQNRAAVQFALDDDRPLAFFAGIWTTWHGKRGTKANPIEGEHQLFGFLTTDANAEVPAIHPKATPVILTSEEAVEQWLTLPPKEALALQKPLRDGALRIVATGEKEDGLAA